MAGFGEVPQKKTTEEEKPKNEAPVEEVDTSYLDFTEGGFAKDPAVVAEQATREVEDNAKADALEAKIKSGEIGEVVVEKSPALEKAQPLIDQYTELRRQLDSQMNFYIGQSDYFILAGNKEGFFQVYSEQREAKLSLGDAYDQALEAYHQAGGEGDLKDISGMQYASTRQEYLDFEKNAMGTQESQFEARKALLARPLAERRSVVAPGSVEATSPYGYSSKLLEDAVRVLDTMPKWKSSENKRRDMEEYYGKQAQGFGLAALEAGDLVPAAQALALAEIVGDLPEDSEVKVRAEKILQTLGEDERAKFAALVKRENDTLKPQIERLINRTQ